MRLHLASILVHLAACSGDDTQPDGVGNDAPTVSIDRPQDGARIATPSAVNLAGSGVDPEDGALSDDALVWTSDLDGLLGTGAALTVALSEGAHRLTLVGTDRGGASAEASVDVVVSGENSPPSPTILAPSMWTVLREGEPLVLEGSADDPEDGPLPTGALVWTSSLDGLWGQGTPLTVGAPSLGEHLVVLTAIDALGASGQASVMVRVAGIGEDVAPFARIESPADGATFTLGQVVTLRGEGLDPETGALSGPALTWSSDRDGALGSGSPLDASLTAGLHAITLTATDPGGSTDDATVFVVVAAPGNAFPTVTIEAPVDGAVVTPSVPLTGRAEDPEDGELLGAALTWASTLAGPLGAGSPLQASLPPGAQTLTLVATDSAGGVAVDAVDVVVVAANTPPVATLLQPASGGAYVAGTPIAFVGEGDDAEDGPLPDGNLFWQSSIDGPFATGATPTFAGLSPGTHTITLIAVDRQGASGTDDITLTLSTPPNPLPPVAALQLPSAGLVGVTVRADASASTDVDGAVVAWTFDWGDGSPATSNGSGLADHIYAAAGAYTVELTVTDDDGLTDVVSAVIDVAVPVRVPTVAYDGVWPAGAFCDLALDANGEPHVLFGELGHEQVLYAEQVAGVWQTTVVDGPGFLVGGLLDRGGSMVLDAAGQPAGAWTVDGRVRYGARGANGVWTVEDVAVAASEAAHVLLVLDPNAGGRPTVVFQSDTSTNRPAVATRGLGSWTVDTWTNLPTWSDQPLRGGAAWLANGSLIFPMGRYSLSYGTWSPMGGFSGPTLIDAVALDDHRTPTLVDPGGVAHILTGGGLFSRSAPPLWSWSDIANTTLDRRALAWDGTSDEPVAAFVNDQGWLEVVRPDVGALWAWSYQGPADATADIDVEVDSVTGDVRACFFRSGNLLVY
jgi:PKD repeat protein